MHNRVFVFGCSFTNYIWPTWADFVGVHFDEYYNYASPGCGNFYIQGKVYEADRSFQFNENDTVYVMLTGTNRLDLYRNGAWSNKGNIAVAAAINKNYRQLINHWSEEYGIYVTWLAIKSIKTLLEDRKVNFKILTAFQQYPIDFTEPGFDNLNNDRTDILEDSAHNLSEEINSELSILTSLSHWTNQHYSPIDHYNVGKGVYKPDLHPTMEMHLKFVEEFLPEFYTDKAIEYYEKYKVDKNDPRNVHPDAFNIRTNKYDHTAFLIKNS